LIIEAFQRGHALVGVELCLLHGGLEHTNGLVIDFDRDRIGMPIFAPCASEKRAGSRKRNGAPWTTSATIASD
jgi:hypothetical protein